MLYRSLRKSNYIDDNVFFTKTSYQSLFSCIIMAIVLSYALVDILEWAQNVYYIRGMLLLMYIILGAAIYASIMYILGYKIKKNYV